VLVRISNMFVPICDHFHTRLANIGKITVFMWCLSLMPSFQVNPLTQGTKFCHNNLVFAAAHSEDFVILACTILLGLQSVMDRQMDGWTPRP